jgi:methyl-accepting chemotaxis protein
MCGLVCAVPVAVLLFFFLSWIERDVEFTRLELKGNRMLRPVGHLQDLVGAHQRLVHLYFLGEEGVKPELDAKAEEIEEKFERVMRYSAEFGAELQLEPDDLAGAGTPDAHPEEIRKSWEKLRDGFDGMEHERAALLHREIVHDLRSLIRHVGNTSNLILDPDLDSYYVMDIELLALPEAVERLGDVALLGMHALERGLLTLEEQVKFAVYATMLEQDDLWPIEASAETALREDPDFYGSCPELQNDLPVAVNDYKVSMRSFIELVRELETRTAPETVGGDFAERAENVRKALGRLRTESSTILEALLSKRLENMQRRARAALTLSLATLAAAALLVFAISRGITRPLGRVMGVASQISEGDVDGARRRLREILPRRENVGNGEGGGDGFDGKHYRDEIWQLTAVFESMTESLHSLLGQVQKTGIQVVGAATEISASSRQLQATAHQQAASTNQVNATSKQIASRSRDLARTIDEVSKLASDSAEMADEGRRGLEDMERSMTDFADATGSISSQLESINEKAVNIGSIVTTITRVSDQTNLLSLNAAIEAEKAGEYGLGFSVVAREIRRLADQTAVATLNIEQMVEEMQTAVTRGVSEADHFVNRVNAAIQQVRRIGRQVSQAIEEMQTFLPRFEEVVQAMGDQREGAGEISNAMSQLADGAEHTRQSIQEFNRAVEQLNGAVQSLQSEVSRFKLEA